MTDGSSLNWEELLAPVQPVPVPACDIGVAAIPLAGAALGAAVADQLGQRLQQWAVSFQLFYFLRMNLFMYFF